MFDYKKLDEYKKLSEDLGVKAFRFRDDYMLAFSQYYGEEEEYLFLKKEDGEEIVRYNMKCWRTFKDSVTSYMRFGHRNLEELEEFINSL